MKEYCVNIHNVKNGHYETYREQSAYTQEYELNQEDRINNIINQA